MAVCYRETALRAVRRRGSLVGWANSLVGWANSFIVCPPFADKRGGQKSIAHPTRLIVGSVELVILGAFLAGLYKKFSYGLVLILHAVSTVSAFKYYLSPFASTHLLFFAAWPMLAACIALFLLRDEDVLLTVRQPLRNA